MRRGLLFLFSSISLFVRAEWTDSNVADLFTAVNNLNTAINNVRNDLGHTGVSVSDKNAYDAASANSTITESVHKVISRIFAANKVIMWNTATITNQLGILDEIESHIESGNATMSEIYTLLNDSNITNLLSTVSQIQSDVHNINSRLVGAIQTSLYDIKSRTGQTADYSRLIAEYLQNTEYQNSTNTLYQLILLNDKFSSLLPLVDSTKSTAENFYLDFLSYRDSLFNRIDEIIGLLRDLKGQGDDTHEYYSGIATSFENFLFYATNHGSGSCNYDFSELQPYLLYGRWIFEDLGEFVFSDIETYHDYPTSSRPSFLQWNTLTNSRTNYVYASPSYWQTTTGNYFVDVIKSFSNLYFLQEQQIKGGIVVHEDIVRCERLLVSVTNRVDNIQTNLVYSLRALQALAHATTNKMDEASQAYEEDKSSTESALSSIESFEDHNSLSVDDGSSIVSAANSFWASLPQGNTLPDSVAFVAATRSTDGKSVSAVYEYTDITQYRWLFNTIRVIATVMSWAALLAFVVACWIAVCKLWAYLSNVAYGVDT